VNILTENTLIKVYLLLQRPEVLHWSVPHVAITHLKRMCLVAPVEGERQKTGEIKDKREGG